MTGEAALLLGFVTALGAIVGSFANVCIHRLPRGESVVTPRSRCPACGRGIAAYDNVPVLSWLLLRGRCRGCGEAISVRYPIVEALFAGTFLASFLLFGPSLSTVAFDLLATASLILVFIDVEARVLPDELTVTGLLAGLSIAVARDLLARGEAPASPWWESSTAASVAGAALGAGLLLLVRVTYQKLRGAEGMGMGDVLMIAMVGAFLGPPATLLALFLASLAGSIVGGGEALVRHAVWWRALSRVRSGAESPAAAAARHGLLLDAEGRVRGAGRRFREIPGAAPEGEKADASGSVARRLSAVVRLALRRSRRGLTTSVSRIVVEEEEGPFFRVLAARATPLADGGALVLLARQDVPFGVFLALGALVAFVAGRSLLEELLGGLVLPGGGLLP